MIGSIHSLVVTKNSLDASNLRIRRRFRTVSSPFYKSNYDIFSPTDNRSITARTLGLVYAKKKKQ